MSDTMKQIGLTGLVPVVVIDDASQAVDTAKALLAGGVNLMEITMRTEAGIAAIENVVKACPDMIVGAGTVLSLEKCREAVQKGAKYIVSPGYNPEIVEWCIQNDVPVCPGCVTPTEIDAALRAGLKVLKFFPANIYGGIKAIKALAGPFVGIQFIPTGGVGLANLADFIDPSVYAIGGGWLCERKEIKSGNYAGITETCKKSVDVLLGLQDASGNGLTLDALMAKGGAATTINLDRSVSQLTRAGREFILKSSDGRTASLEKGGVSVSLSLR